MWRFTLSKYSSARSFSKINHTYLRDLNRQMKYQDVISAFQEADITDDQELLKCRQQYLFAASRQLLLTQVDSNAPQPNLEGMGQSSSEPLQLVNVGNAEINQKSIFGRLFNIAFMGFGLLFLLNLNNLSPGGISLGGKSFILAEKSDVTFDNVKGIDECKEELEEIVHYLRNVNQYVKLGANMPKGLLLTGPPGTGKTLLAKAIAGEAGINFFYCSGSDFDEVFVGLGAKRVRELFAEAKAHAPSIIFIDEIDAVGGSRKAQDISYSRQSLNQLLVEMDGFTNNDQILVIAATNFKESLDHALTRPGRFDKKIDLFLPDIKGREEILRLYLDQIHYEPDVNINTLARSSIGMTGADLKNLVNQAILHAVKENRTSASSLDFEHAIDRLRLGIQYKKRQISKKDQIRTAYHELGHVLMLYISGSSTKDFHKTTIIPRGPSGGATSFLPVKEEMSASRTTVLSDIDVFMGGRVAEEIFLGKEYVSLGCSSDLQNATKLAYYVVRQGMFNEITGHIFYEDEVVGQDHKDKMDEAVKLLLSESYARTQKFLQMNKGLINFLCEKLLQMETLTSKLQVEDQIDQLISEYGQVVKQVQQQQVFHFQGKCW